MRDRELDFDALQLRLHPTESRVTKLAHQTPASFVAFDLLAVRSRSLMASPLLERRGQLETLLAHAVPPIHITPMTLDHSVAVDWLSRFEGAGLDGVVAKAKDAPYAPGKRSMIKVKHVRTADCAVAGFRWHKTGKGAIGSLLLGLYDEARALHHVGVTWSFTMAVRKQLVKELTPLRHDAAAHHPWCRWAKIGDDTRARMPGAQSRWSAGKDLSWKPVRIERVCEVRDDRLQGDRFRHATTFLRWRADKRPSESRHARGASQIRYRTPATTGRRGR